MAQAQVDEHGSLVLGDRRVVDRAYLWELVWVDEVERGRADEFVGFEACGRGSAVEVHGRW